MNQGLCHKAESVPGLVGQQPLLQAQTLYKRGGGAGQGGGTQKTG